MALFDLLKPRGTPFVYRANEFERFRKPKGFKQKINKRLKK